MPKSRKKRKNGKTKPASIELRRAHREKQEDSGRRYLDEEQP